MARLPRFFVPGYPVHVIQRGNNRVSIFHTTRDFIHYLELLADAATANGLKIHGHVLMSNHVHLVATPGSPISLPRTMQSVGTSYVRWFNRHYGRTGTLWEGRYRATIVDTDAYLLTCLRYIELNPVRAGLVDDPASYRWSSYGANALGADDPLVTPHPLFLALGEAVLARHAAYRCLFVRPVSEEQLHAIRRATNLAWALGDEAFQAHVEQATGRRAAPLPRNWIGRTVAGLPAGSTLSTAVAHPQQSSLTPIESVSSTGMALSQNVSLLLTAGAPLTPVALPL